MGPAGLTQTNEIQDLGCQTSEGGAHSFQRDAGALSNQVCAKVLPLRDCDTTEKPFALFATEFGEWLAVLRPSSIEALLDAGQLHILLPAGFPTEWPSWIPARRRDEAIDPVIFALHAIEDEVDRAEAILTAGVVDMDDRSRALIESVADAHWPGALVQGLLRPTADEQAMMERLAENRDFFLSEGQRILRSLKRSSPELLRDMRMRAFPHLMPRAKDLDEPSLLDFLAEPDAKQRSQR